MTPRQVFLTEVPSDFGLPLLPSGVLHLSQ